MLEDPLSFSLSLSSSSFRRLSAAHAPAMVRPASDVNRLRIGAASVARRGARLDKAEDALSPAPGALLTRIERAHLRLPRRLAVVIGQRRADRPAKDAAERRAGWNRRCRNSGGRGRDR